METTAEIIDDTELSVKHKQIQKLAKVLKIFSWVVLTFIILYSIYTVFKSVFYCMENSRLFALSLDCNYLTLISENPLIVIRFILDGLFILIRGLVYVLVLRGVAQGLLMVIETDINYRLRDN